VGVDVAASAPHRVIVVAPHSVVEAPTVGAPSSVTAPPSVTAQPSVMAPPLTVTTGSRYTYLWLVATQNVHVPLRCCTNTHHSFPAFSVPLSTWDLPWFVFSVSLFPSFLIENFDWIKVDIIFFFNKI